MNFEVLSEKARAVTTAFALLDASPASKDLVEQLDNSYTTDPLTFIEVVQVELGETASLIKVQKSDEGAHFRMH